MKLKGTSMKYYNCIQGFLDIVYATEYRDLNSKYTNNILSITKNNQCFPTLLELVNAYVELINAGRFEDALIIHLMYFLEVNPDTIALLTFSFINELSNVKFWDPSSASQIEKNFNDNLIRDIKFFKDWRIKQNRKIQIQTRKDNKKTIQ